MGMTWNLDDPGMPDMTIITDNGGVIQHDAETGETTYTTPDGHTTNAGGAYTSKDGNTYTWGKGSQNTSTSQTEYATHDSGDNKADEDYLDDTSSGSKENSGGKQTEYATHDSGDNKADEDYLDDASSGGSKESSGVKQIEPITKRQFGGASKTQEAPEYATKTGGDNSSEADPYLSQQAGDYSDSPYEYMRERRWESKGVVQSGSGYDPITGKHTDTAGYASNATESAEKTKEPVSKKTLGNGNGDGRVSAAEAINTAVISGTMVQGAGGVGVVVQNTSERSRDNTGATAQNGYTQEQFTPNPRCIGDPAWSGRSKTYVEPIDGTQPYKVESIEGTAGSEANPITPIGPGAEPWKFQDSSEANPITPIGPGAEPWKFQDVANGSTTGNGVIAWDTELMAQHVAKLLRAAEDLQSASATLNIIKERISTAWDGNAAAVFLSEMCIDIADYQKVVENIKVLAEALTRVINVYNECEGTVASGMSTLDTQLTALQGTYA